MTRVLFVDDEANILRALRRVLRRVAGEWTVTFVGSGEEALTAIQCEQFDAVVSDCMMPGMDGGTLVTRIRATHPGMVRILLTGNAPTQTMIAGEAVAHRLLAKPCPPEKLRATVDSALVALRTIPEGPLRDLVAGTPTLPTLPSVVDSLEDAVGDGSAPANIECVADLVDGDPALESKFLKIAHADFFGGSSDPVTGGDAVRRLGPDTVSLLLRLGLPADGSIPLGLDLAAEHRHGFAVGEAAAALAAHHGFGPDRVMTARLAGRLIGVGRMIAAAGRREDWIGAGTAIATPGLGSIEAETEILGVPAARLGAALLGLWGLPASVTAAMRGAPSPEPDSLAAIVAAADQAVRDGGASGASGASGAVAA